MVVVHVLHEGDVGDGEGVVGSDGIVGELVGECGDGGDSLRRDVREL